MVSIRRYLHENPELSFQEVHTSAFIADYHCKLGLEVREKVGGGGVVATLKGGKPGKTVALRADFDALAIQQLNDVPYRSKVDGVMHACGHDGHTATLLLLAKVLTEMQKEIEGSIIFIHQHAEEMLPGGAIAMIEAGCLEGVDAIFGTHLMSPIPLGEVFVREGAIMAGGDSFEILIQGKGGHGAEPHQTIDSIVIGSQFVTQLQTLISRRMSPLDASVVSVGSFEAINPLNVIAHQAKLKGTVRSLNDDSRKKIKEEMEVLLKGTCLGMNATYEFDYTVGYPAVKNHSYETKIVENVAEQLKDVEKVTVCEPLMVSEDFAYYLQHVPGTFFLTGAKNPEWDQAYPHHHGRFNFDERAMLIAAQVLGEATLEYLKTAVKKEIVLVKED